MFTELWTGVRKRRELRRNATLTRTQLETLQLTKFRGLVRHAQRHSPYYAQLIEERAIRVGSCTPADFPLLTKSILMANFDRIVTDRRITKEAIGKFLTHSTDPADLFLDKYRVIHTSGTSGEVGYFVYSATDWANGMSAGAAQRQAPPRKDSLRRWRVGFYGATGGHFAGVTMASSARRGIARLIFKFGVFEINRPLPETIAALNAFQPDFLSGYTTALKMLAAKQRSGSLRIAPRGIAAGGEVVTAADMAILREAFGADVVSTYGCSEHLLMGASPPNEDSVNLFNDDLMFEFYDDHSVITNLFNRTLPLIRYRMSDILRPVASNDPESRQLTISGLVGRTETVPVFINQDGVEDFISPHTINEIFVAGVMRFQLQVLDRASFRFAVVLDPGLSAQQYGATLAAVDERLREILRQKQMSNVRFDVEDVNDLPLDPRTRKFRLIVAAS